METNTESADTLVGQRLGPPGHQYEILDLLGRGGMGPVYRAQQLNLPRQVAIKVIDPQLVGDAGFVERFHREAHAIASLEHANILPVYDFGEHEGLLYLVMRLVRGGTVKDRFTRDGSRPWPPERVLHLARQILPALDHAHRLGVIHRDIKPANILLEEDWAYLADFGIAKLAAGADVGPALTLTAAGMMVGTPHYMAPEQVRGQPLDGRADLYAFGVVVYELLTGTVPFHGETPLEVAIHHLETPLPEARTVNPDVPVTVEDVLRRALAKDRDARYPTGAAFLAALTSAIATLPAGWAGLPEAHEPAPQVTQAAHAPSVNPPPAAATVLDSAVGGAGGVAAPTVAGAAPAPPSPTIAGTAPVPAAAPTSTAAGTAAVPSAAPSATVAAPAPVAGAAPAPVREVVAGLGAGTPAAAAAAPAAVAPAAPTPAAPAPAAAAPAKGAPARGAAATLAGEGAQLLRDVAYYTVLWALVGTLLALGAAGQGVAPGAAPSPDGLGVALWTLALVGGVGVVSGSIRSTLARTARGGLFWSVVILGAVAVVVGLASAPTLERLVMALRAAGSAALAAGQTPEGRAAALRVVGLAAGAGAVGGVIRCTLARSVWGGLFWAVFWAVLAALLFAGAGGAVADVSRAALLGAIGGFLGSAAGRLWVPRH